MAISDESGHRCIGKDCPICEKNVLNNTTGKPASGPRPVGTRRKKPNGC